MLGAGSPKGTCPPGLTCLQETEDHTAQEAGAHGGGGAGRGPSGLSVDERERGSLGSPSEMSVFLPGPRANLSLRGPRPFPWRLKSEMNLSEPFTTRRPIQDNRRNLTGCCNLSENIEGFSVDVKLIKCFVCSSPEISLH